VLQLEPPNTPPQEEMEQKSRPELMTMDMESLKNFCREWKIQLVIRKDQRVDKYYIYKQMESVRTGNQKPYKP
jgi:hypothetical protein